jgi:1-acyl-sn-glycerol-3-phosphate acyltransferase
MSTAHTAIIWLVRAGIMGASRLLIGAKPRWQGCGPVGGQRIYFANHRSHGDFLSIWSALPPSLRRQARPVAGADYWDEGEVRRFIGRDIFNAVLIERSAAAATRADVLAPVTAALKEGASLILFPEGTRNESDAALMPFKSGIYYVALDWPGIDLVPVWIENAGRVMPKGEWLPIPLLCSATFGAPMHLEAGETKGAFLARAQDALLALAPRKGDAA